MMRLLACLDVSWSLDSPLDDQLRIAYVGLSREGVEGELNIIRRRLLLGR